MTAMNTFFTSLSRTGAVALLVALALLAAAGAPAQARTAPPTPTPALAAAAPTFADDVSFTRWLRGYLNRNHIVQICVVMMLLALFIIIKKFNGHG
jgi:hypothetical protein